MRPDDPRESSFALVREMCETPDVVRQFDVDQIDEQTLSEIRETQTVLLTGEGSSRIFPAKSAIAQARREGYPLSIFTEAARQSQEYPLDRAAVVGVSNSGKTAEAIGLFKKLRAAGHSKTYSLTASANSPLEAEARRGWVLTCGKEDAVAATKSVVEQALFQRSLVEGLANDRKLAASRESLATAIDQALRTDVPAEIVDKLANATTIFWAGRNDGVAEELTLKTNEIARKPSDWLEGTYAVHGIEEAMRPTDVIVWVRPYPDSIEKFRKTLVEGVGATIVAISAEPTPFPTLRVPDAGRYSDFVELCAGWNLLVATGLALGIDLDKPQRARKVGYEYSATPQS